MTPITIEYDSFRCHIYPWVVVKEMTLPKFKKLVKLMSLDNIEEFLNDCYELEKQYKASDYKGNREKDLERLNKFRVILEARL